MPFQSGYSNESEVYYVAELDFKEVERYYQEVILPYNTKSRVADIDFWYRECVPGYMDVSKITLKAARLKGLFIEIEAVLGLTNEKNRALTIYNLAQKFGCTPIELINKVVKITH